MVCKIPAFSPIAWQYYLWRKSFLMALCIPVLIFCTQLFLHNDVPHVLHETLRTTARIYAWIFIPCLLGLRLLYGLTHRNDSTDYFFTCTDSGILLEQHDSANFYPWQCCRKLGREGQGLMIVTTSGKGVLLNLAGMKAARRAEFLRFLAAHINRNATQPPIPPPAELLTEAPYSYQATAKQQVEYSGLSLKHFSPFLRPVIALMVIAAGAYGLYGIAMSSGAELIFSGGAVLIALMLSTALRKGKGTMQHPACKLHSTGNKLLLVCDDGSWMWYDTALITSASAGQHLTLYHTQDITSIAADAALPGLPQPQRVRDRRLSVPAFYAIWILLLATAFVVHQYNSLPSLLKRAVAEPLDTQLERRIAERIVCHVKNPTVDIKNDPQTEVNLFKTGDTYELYVHKRGEFLLLFTLDSEGNILNTKIMPATPNATEENTAHSSTQSADAQQP